MYPYTRMVLLAAMVAGLFGNVLFAQQSSLAAPAGANAARLVKFSGTMKDGAGAPLTGTMGLAIAIYSTQQGGTPLWMETQNVQLDAQGNYSVLLGSTQSEGLPLELFSTGESRWLGVQAQAPGEVEQPRVLLVSVPYALKAADAETLGGKPLSAFMLAAPDATGTQAASTIDSGKNIVSNVAAAVSGAAAPAPPVTSSGGTLNKLPKWDTSTDLIDSAVYESGGKVGIGTTTPSEVLEVNGSFKMLNADANNTKFQATGGVTPRFQTGISGDGGFQFQSLDGSANRKFYLMGHLGIAYFQVDMETGNLTNYGQIGIGTNPLNSLDSTGGAAIGSYAGVNAAPAGGLIVSGNVGVGTATPSQPFEVSGTAKATTFRFGDNTTQSTAGVAKTGDTMSGALNLPANGLNVGSGQLAVSGGNVTANGSVTAASFNGSGAALTGVGTITSITTAGGSGLTGGANSGVANLAMSAANRTRGIVYIAGTDSGSVLATTDSQHTIYSDVIGALTINSITCYVDGGSGTIVNVVHNVAGVTNDVLTSNLTCSNAAAGAVSTTFNGSQNVLASGDTLDFSLRTADGVAKRATLVLKATVN